MGSLQEQMVAAMESRASSKSETAALRNVLSVVLTSSSSFSSYSRSEKFNSCTPPEKKASPRSVRMQGAKSWAC